MVDINNIVSRGGYLVDGATGEKVLFYECDPRKNTECNHEMRAVKRGLSIQLAGSGDHPPAG